MNNKFDAKGIIKTLGILVPVVIAGIVDYTGRMEERKQSEHIEELENRLADLEQRTN